MLAVGVLAALGWLLRAWPWPVWVGFDETVYFSAAALLAKGILPYRDFTFVHPPGIALFYLPVTVLADPETAFLVARWLASVVGGANIALSGVLAYRCAGPIAAIVAAGLYAIYPQVVFSERSTYLEPVMNLACLALANVWLSHRLECRPRWALLAGLFLGFALMVKLTAATWALACLVSGPARQREAFVSLAIGTLLAAAVLLPFALVAPHNLFEQIVLFHAWRPPDGIIQLSARLIDIFSRHTVVAAMAAMGIAWQLVAAAKTRKSVPRCTRLFSVVAGLMLALFLLASNYWSSYPSALAPAETQLAAAFAANLFRTSTRIRCLGPLVASLLLAFSALQSLQSVKARVRVLANDGSGEAMIVFGQLVRERVPASACLFAFEPKWGLAAGRLPQQLRDGRLMLDVYGDMLLAARRSGLRFSAVEQALHAQAAQERIRWLLDGCDYLVMDRRGRWQLGEETQHWVAEHYERTAGTSQVDLWQRRH
jgi:hypothetical protein